MEQVITRPNVQWKESEEGLVHLITKGACLTGKEKVLVYEMLKSLTQQHLIERVALTANDCMLRCLAIARVESSEILELIAMDTAARKEERCQALQNTACILSRERLERIIAVNLPDADVMHVLLEAERHEFTSQMLEEIVMNEKNPDTVRIHAMKNSKCNISEEYLFEIAKSSSTLIETAIDFINEQSFLIQLAMHCIDSTNEHCYKSTERVFKRLLDKIEDYTLLVDKYSEEISTYVARASDTYNAEHYTYTTNSSIGKVKLICLLIESLESQEQISKFILNKPFSEIPTEIISTVTTKITDQDCIEKLFEILRYSDYATYLLLKSTSSDFLERVMLEEHGNIAFMAMERFISLENEKKLNK